jgi:hypothetical protein
MSDLYGNRLVEGRPMSEQHDEQIKAMIAHHTVVRHRRESDGVGACQRGRMLQVEHEMPLPADVPLHKRGFGVMEEDGS